MNFKDKCFELLLQMKSLIESYIICLMTNLALLLTAFQFCINIMNEILKINSKYPYCK